MRQLPKEIAEHWMTANEACSVLGVSKTTIFRKADAGLLEKAPVLYGRDALISRSSVNQYINRFKVS